MHGPRGIELLSAVRIEDGGGGLPLLLGRQARAGPCRESVEASKKLICVTGAATSIACQPESVNWRSPSQ